MVVFTHSMLGGGLALAAAGCQDTAGDCDALLTCKDNTTKPPPSQDPDCKSAPRLLKTAPLAKCGVFASPSGTAAGTGTLALPFRSLQQAIDAAGTGGTRVVYACAATFAEAVHVPSGISIYGGLDCANGWLWKDSARTILAPVAADKGTTTSEIGLKLDAGDGDTVLEDVDVHAPDATRPGVSSVAVLIADTKADLSRCDLVAGDGADGGAGTHPMDDPALDGIDGSAGFAICSAAAVNPGATGPVKACGNLSTAGGDGGSGGPPSGSDLEGGAGAAGVPIEDTEPSAGIGGDGQSVASCVAGTQGAPGVEGDEGKGGSGVVSLSSNGIASHAGVAGLAGVPGQGGGGGGGAKGKSGIQCTGSAVQDRAGASGGAGGTGGCGGLGGGGGQAGGSSVALVSLGKQAVTLASVTLRLGKAGAGGPGAEGQSGGNRGKGASGGDGFGGTSAACSGGDGGQGGNGGPGGGGQGGSVIGIAYSQSAPAGLAPISFKSTPPTAGKGGAAGPGAADPTMGAGADGQAIEKLQAAP